MTTEQPAQIPLPDMARVSQDLAELARRNQEMFAEALKAPGDVMRKLDPLNFSGTMADAANRMRFDPARLMQANLELWQQHMQLWQSVSQRLMGQAAQPVAKPEKGDRRFRDLLAKTPMATMQGMAARNLGMWTDMQKAFVDAMTAGQGKKP